MSYVPLKVELMSMHGISESMEAMRLPKDGVESDTTNNAVGPKDSTRAASLICGGDSHAKVMRGIITWLKVEMQVGFMIEFETHRHGAECLSTSSTVHNELRGMSGPELAEKKQAGLPDKVYVRILTASYQVLRNMYLLRRNHRHPDWQIFCDFIETLPYFDLLIRPEKRGELSPLMKRITWVLREADADLQGVLQRGYLQDVATCDLEAAESTRKTIAQVYEMITGKSYIP